MSKKTILLLFITVVHLVQGETWALAFWDGQFTVSCTNLDTENKFKHVYDSEVVQSQFFCTKNATDFFVMKFLDTHYDRMRAIGSEGYSFNEHRMIPDHMSKKTTILSVTDGVISDDSYQEWYGKELDRPCGVHDFFENYTYCGVNYSSFWKGPYCDDPYPLLREITGLITKADIQKFCTGHDVLHSTKYIHKSESNDISLPSCLIILNFMVFIMVFFL